MRDVRAYKSSLAVVALLAGSSAFIEGTVAEVPDQKQSQVLVKPPRPAPMKIPQRVTPSMPATEPEVTTTSNAGFSTSSVFSARPSAVTPNATTLSPPVSLTYSGSSTAFQLNDSGTGRGLSASLTNASDAGSALYGDTVGTGAGLTGFNKGTSGPGGKFQVTNANSSHAGAFGSTNGTGPAILGTVTNTTSYYPAIYGLSTSAAAYGEGVEGDGNYIGVLGIITSNSTSSFSAAIYGVNEVSASNASGGNYGVYGSSGAGIGTAGISTNNYGVYGSSINSYGIYAYSNDGPAAIYADNANTSTSAYGIYATVGAGNAIEAIATANYGFGVEAQSTNGAAVVAIDHGNGTGIRAGSSTGLAGEFDGNVSISGTLTVGSTTYTSDRRLKTDEGPIDSKDILERLSHLPISTWTYTSDPGKRHVGPMAQDFHDAFGLNGADETHINEVDVAGVGLAAIQELNNQMKLKDSQIAALKAEAAAQKQLMAQIVNTFSARMTALERRAAATSQTVRLESPRDVWGAG